MNCPIDGNALDAATEGQIQLERCPACKGEWFTPEQLDALERSASDAAAAAGTIEFEERPSALKCPVCSAAMVAFDFRGEALELNACNAGHGFWLDGGEEGRVRELMRERERDIRRAGRAEFDWNKERLRGFSPNLVERIRNLIKGH